MHDQNLDIDQRNAALDEARTLIRELHGFADGRLENAEVDRLLADYRARHGLVSWEETVTRLLALQDAPQQEAMP